MYFYTLRILTFDNILKWNSLWEGYEILTRNSFVWRSLGYLTLLFYRHYCLLEATKVARVI